MVRSWESRQTTITFLRRKKKKRKRHGSFSSWKRPTRRTTKDAKATRRDKTRKIFSKRNRKKRVKIERSRMREKEKTGAGKVNRKYSLLSLQLQEI